MSLVLFSIWILTSTGLVQRDEKRQAEVNFDLWHTLLYNRFMSPKYNYVYLLIYNIRTVDFFFSSHFQRSPL